MDFQQLKQIINMVKSGGNPNIIFQNMAQNNPQMQQVLQMCQGQNPEQLFYTLCQKQGVNPNDILSLFK